MNKTVWFFLMTVHSLSNLCFICKKRPSLRGKNVCHGAPCKNKLRLGNLALSSKRSSSGDRSSLRFVKKRRFDQRSEPMEAEKCLFYDEVLEKMEDGITDPLFDQKFSPFDLEEDFDGILYDGSSDDDSVISSDDSESGAGDNTGVEEGVNNDMGISDDDQPGARGREAGVGVTGPTVVICCQNCKRSPYEPRRSESSLHSVMLSPVSVQRIHFRYAFSNMKKSEFGAEVEISLCQECSNYLQRENVGAKSQLDQEQAWPSYLYRLLRDENSSLSVFVWKFLPVEFRARWVHCFTQYQLNRPISLAKDITNSKSHFEKTMKSQQLGKIIKCVNQRLRPTVLCPWGCCDYVHSVGTMPLDTIVNRYFSPKEFDLIGSVNRMQYVESARGDYIREKSTDYPDLLSNQDWPVRPCMFLTNRRELVFSTCRNHNKGTKMKYFHIPRQPQPHILPSKMPDQLAHAVAVPRTVRSMRRSKYNTSYDTLRAHATYSGFDTSSVVDVGRTDFMSCLTEEKESLSLRGRHDIQFLLAELVASDKVSQSYADDLKRSAAKWYPSTGRLDNFGDGTFVTFEDSVILQKNLNADNIRSVKVPIPTSAPRRRRRAPTHVSLNYKMSWPRHIFWLHKNDGYGSRFPDIPLFKDNTLDSRLAWNTISILSFVPVLWGAVSESVTRSDTWHGHMLSASASIFFQHMKVQANMINGVNNPFRKGHSLKVIQQVLGKYGNAKFYSASSIETMFSCVPGVSVVRLNRGVRDCFARHYSSMSLTRKEHLKCVIITQVYGRGATYNNTERPPDDITVGGTVYELRYLFVSNTTTHSDWTGSVYARHGGELFPSWWKQDRCKLGRMTEVDGGVMPDVHMYWDCCVYVRKKVLTLAQLRDDYLTGIGGQTRATCEEHSVPLVVSPYSNRAKINNHGITHCCCEINAEGSSVPTVCLQKSCFQCPVIGCQASICKECYEVIPKGGNVAVGNPARDSTGTNDLLTTYDVTDNDNMVTNDGSGDAYSEIDDSRVAMSGILDVEELNDGSGVVVDEFYLGDAYDEYDDDDFVIPTTHAGEEPFVVTVNDQGIRLQDSVPAHIIMNQCGTLLTRHKTQLRGTLKQKFFLQRYAAVTRGKSLPLVYPEAMLYPSVFWKQGKDGASCIGAIPSSLLGMPQHANSFGIASFRDHARTRLTSSDCTSSTDTRYLSHLFDCVANTSLTGNDSRVVLARGFLDTGTPCGMRLKSEDDDFYTDSIDNRQCVHNLAASEKDSPSTLFLTFTCNQTETMGVAPIKRWIDSDAAIDRIVSITPRFTSDN